MFKFFKKIFQPEKPTYKTIAEMEQQKHDLEVQFELLIELEKKIREQKEEESNT